MNTSPNLAGRGILEKSKRPSAYEPPAAKDAGELHSYVRTPVSEESHKSLQNDPAIGEGVMRPLSAEAALLGEVERMPDDLDLRVSGNPFAKRTTALASGGKMKPSSYFQANEIKQSKRNRCVLVPIQDF